MESCAAGAAPVEGGVPSAASGMDLQQRWPPAGAEIPAAHGPARNAPGNVSRRVLHSSDSESVCDLPVNAAPLANDDRAARFPAAVLGEIGGADSRHIRADVRAAGGRQTEGSRRTLPRATLRGFGARSD